MSCDCVIQYLEKIDAPILIKDRHTILELDEENVYVLKEGIIKVSMILDDNREFNITYLKGTDVVSFFSEGLLETTTAHIRIRIESEIACFYYVSREVFTKQVKQDSNLRSYVNSYYRNQLKNAIYRQQLMIMNSKTGAVCAFIYRTISLFGKKTQNGILINLQITNEDIASFCGISTRNSVNRIIRSLKEKHVIQIVNNKIVVLDPDYLKQFTERG